jgi:hypothetical protein
MNCLREKTLQVFSKRLRTESFVSKDLKFVLHCSMIASGLQFSVALAFMCCEISTGFPHCVESKQSKTLCRNRDLGKKLVFKPYFCKPLCNRTEICSTTNFRSFETKDQTSKTLSIVSNDLKFVVSSTFFKKGTVNNLKNTAAHNITQPYIDTVVHKFCGK